MREKKFILLLIVFTLGLVYNVISNKNKYEISSLSIEETSSEPTEGTETTTETENETSKSKLSKRILFWGTLYGASNLMDYCIENTSMEFCNFNCEYAVNQSLLNSSDAVVIHGRERNEMKLPTVRTPNQHWVFLMFESPANSWTDISNWNNQFNWTMSYRNDSDLPIPYGRLLRVAKTDRLNQKGIERLPNLQSIGKKKAIAWAVSNCDLVTSRRRELVDDISKYIPVDIYGKCGQYKCVRSHMTTRDQCSNPSRCHEYLGSRYKFYLAFENSLCPEYITEKFFNSLKYGMIPIVHGPPKKFYLQIAPEGSFIHVADYSSIKQLTDHLKFLDQNSREYSKYFEWRKYFTLDKVYYFQRAWCDLCEKLHKVQENERFVYPSIEDWWFYKDNPRVEEQPCYEQNVTKTQF